MSLIPSRSSDLNTESTRRTQNLKFEASLKHNKTFRVGYQGWQKSLQLVVKLLTVIHGIILVIILVLRILLDHGGVRVVVPEDVRLRADVLLVNSPRAPGGKDVLVEDDEVLDQLVDKVLVDDLVPVRGDGHQGRAETDGQVVWIHHVLIAEIEKLSL